MRFVFAAMLIAGSIVPGGAVQAQQIEKKEFNVIGTWNFLTNWQKLEQPLWTADLPAASNGSITGNIKSITELNLKGTELLRLIKREPLTVLFGQSGLGKSSLLQAGVFPRLRAANFCAQPTPRT